jgi:hypothetical protein
MAVAVLLHALAKSEAAAEMLDALFPEGVPGFDTTPGVTVQSRLRPDTEPLGVRAGSFLLHPRLDSSFGYDSNVLGGSPSRGSWVSELHPSFGFGSDWSRDALGGSISLSNTRYLNLPAQTRTDGSAAIGGALDIGQDRLSAGFAHFAQHEDRTQLDAIASDRPIAFVLDDARLGYTARFSRWTLTPAMELSRWRFDDTTILGQTASQAYRDRDVARGSLTLGYELSAKRDVIVLMRATGQRYPDTPAGQPSMNSTSYELLAGIDYDDDAVWRHRLLIGTETRTFSAFQTHTALVAEADIAWMPNGLTTVHARVNRSIEDAAQEGIAGYTYTGARLTLDHEYLRDLLLGASIGVQHASFLQGGQQTGGTFGMSATWLVNRSVRLSATYDLSSLGGGGSAARSSLTHAAATGATLRSLSMLKLGLAL